MAHSPADWTGRWRCSYKSVTFILCTGNVLMVFFMLHAALSPIYVDSSSSASFDFQDRIQQTTEELERIEDSNRLRREFLPLQLIERVKEIQEEAELEMQKTEALNLARQKIAAELSQRLRELKLSNSQSTLKALEEWKKKKLEQRNSLAHAPTMGGKEKENAAVIKRIERRSMPKRRNKGDSSENSDMDHDVIPGRAVPPECHAEAHTDFDGTAVRWGLSHHVASAADCCQACFDQANAATDRHKRCNVWVYCPSEGGCFSPDRYKHKNHECWLKQAEEPVINFKGHYDEEFRKQNPRAPPVVPWVSGFLS